MFKAERVTAMGAMSGTSLDGVDAAIIETDGERVFAFGPSRFQAYTPPQREVLRYVLGKWQSDDTSEAAELVETVHYQVMSALPDADIAGFHGQTIAHDPSGRGTHQIGDGAVLADLLNMPVVWDFRSADVKLGGQGAPLAPFYHFALAKWIKADAPVVFLNLGGVGNLTYVDPAFDRPEAEGALLAFDTGPANAPLNDMMQSRLGRDRDEKGALAGSGSVKDAIIERFLAAPFFFKMPPKSLDRDDFKDLLPAVAALSDADAAATLTAAIAASVAHGLDMCPARPKQLLVTGGGRHNDTLMHMLAAACACDVAPVESVGLDGDMLEAQAFAFLAVRVARGMATSAPGTTGVRALVGGGTLSTPRS